MRVTTFGSFGKKRVYTDVVKVEIGFPDDLVIIQNKVTAEITSYIEFEDCNSLIIDEGEEEEKK